MTLQNLFEFIYTEHVLLVFSQGVGTDEHFNSLLSEQSSNLLRY